MPAGLINFFKKLFAESFYGTVTIGFQAGKPTTIKKEQTFKVDELT